ncbi:hypothetical protein EV182_005655 [Spiromyces aspiralis]|uniref:Uncharacterized protein n=1 Tax=Spiromyces aspiralis TaxID=68401 RepID=A0ACC1HQS0_9FUNG|nr:hypothetical protein EV182_005655 [Spiromyces aspiralis]
MCLFLGLDLMRLLVQDRVADFHVALERIDLKYHSDPNVALPIRAEQYLMEGTYKRIKQEEDKLADNRFKFFFAELRTRNRQYRKEIADCIQKSYTEIPIAEAKRILLWDNRQNFEKFMVECGWHNCVVGNEILVFKSDKDDSPAYLNDDIIDQNLQYAQELERIV